VVICVDGEGTIADSAGEKLPIHRGETILVPASVDGVRLTPAGSMKILTGLID